MSTLADFKIALQLLRSPGSDEGDLAARLNGFYDGQAASYDEFRRRLLPGRQALIEALPLPPDAIVVDMGGGTGANIEWLSAQQQSQIDRWYLVDLCRPLLEVAEERTRTAGFVRLCEADATIWSPQAPVDVVIFSYSLTMIPDWTAALENAMGMLKPGGSLVVVDFYVSRKFSDTAQHGWLTRTFWPAWFAWDNVFLSPDHLPWLMRHLEDIALHESTTRLPLLPGSRVPWYRLQGRKPMTDKA